MLHTLVIGALGAIAVMFSSTAFARGTATVMVRHRAALQYRGPRPRANEDPADSLYTDQRNLLTCPADLAR